VKNLQLIETLLDDKKLYYNETNFFFLFLSAKHILKKKVVLWRKVYNDSNSKPKTLTFRQTCTQAHFWERFCKRELNIWVTKFLLVRNLVKHISSALLVALVRNHLIKRILLAQKQGHGNVLATQTVEKWTSRNFGRQNHKTFQNLNC